MSRFYHPYNFIPATGKVDGVNVSTVKYDYHLPPDKQKGASQNARHDLYLINQFSGRIICQLETITPTVIGNKHEKQNSNNNSPVTIKPYRWRKQPAIPANSLRGMISNIVEILSQSSLRVLSKAKNKNYWPLFEAINPDLLPWHDNREELTAAELIFGVVEDNEKDNGDSRNLASRVRFYDALSVKSFTPDSKVMSDTQLLPIMPLKEMAESDPRAKDGYNFNMGKGTYNNYFFNPNNVSPTHEEVRNELNGLENNKNQIESVTLLPRGRKFYLLHQNEQGVNYYKNDKNSNDRKACCEPIKQGEQFYFHIDFENLTNTELTLLKQSLAPDHTDFHHRIGLGKSIGLGIVKIKISSIFLKNNAQRYSGIITKKYRYQEINTLGRSLDGWKKLEDRYRFEIEAISSIEQIKLKDDFSLIDKTSQNLLKQTGDYSYLDSTFKVRWRGKEDKGAPLPLMSSDNKKLPPIIPPNKSSKEPQQTTNYIQTEREENTPEIQWIRNKILEHCNIPFDELSENVIKTRLTSHDIAKQWRDLPEKKPEEIIFKIAVKQLVLNSAKDRKIEGYWKSGGAKRAKKIYDDWEAPKQM